MTFNGFSSILRQNDYPEDHYASNNEHPIVDAESPDWSVGGEKVHNLIHRTDLYRRPRIKISIISAAKRLIPRQRVLEGGLIQLRDGLAAAYADFLRGSHRTAPQ